MQPIRRALISVSDKTGLVDFARALAARGIEILSTGGTASLLTEQEIPVRGLDADQGPVTGQRIRDPRHVHQIHQTDLVPT